MATEPQTMMQKIDLGPNMFCCKPQTEGKFYTACGECPAPNYNKGTIGCAFLAFIGFIIMIAANSPILFGLCLITSLCLCACPYCGSPPADGDAPATSGDASGDKSGGAAASGGGGGDGGTSSYMPSGGKTIEMVLVDDESKAPLGGGGAPSAPDALGDDQNV